MIMVQKITRKESASRWERYINDARILRMSILDREENLKFPRDKDEPVRQFYAVDTNVITFYTNPNNIDSLAAIFHDDDSIARRALAYELSDYLFFRFLDPTWGGKHFPFFMLPSHQMELGNIILALEKKAEEDELETYAQGESLQIALNNIASIKGDNNADKIADYLIKNAPKLISSLYGIPDVHADSLSPQVELTRLTELLQKTRLADYASCKEMTVPDVSNKEVSNDIKNKTERWKKLLQQAIDKKLTAGTRLLIQRDAEALAQIQWVNEAFQEEEENKRLYFLTADNKVLAAVDKAYRDGEIDFDFTRHPRGFIADQEINQAKYIRPKDLDLKSFLDLLLEWRQPAPSGFRERLRKEFTYREGAEKVFSIIMDARASHVLESFKNNSTAIATTSSLFNRLADEKRLTDDAKRFAHEINKTKDVASAVHKRYVAMADNLWNSANTAMLDALELPSKDPKTSKRSALKDLLIEVQKSSSERRPVMLRWPLEGRRLRDFLKSVVKASKEKDLDLVEHPEGEEGTVKNYLLMIYLSALSARWGAVALNSERLAAKELPDKLKWVSQEAKYLMAVSYRHMACNRTSLFKKAQDVLLELEKDDPNDLRYEVENLALHLMALNCKEFHPDLEPCGLTDNYLAVDELGEKLLSAREKISTDDLEKDDLVKESLRKQVLTYILILSLIIKHKIKSTELSILSAAEEVFEEFEKVAQDLGDSTPILTTAVYHLSLLSFSSKTKAQKSKSYRKLREIYQLLKDKDLEQKLPFEKSRIEFVRGLMKSGAFGVDGNQDND